MMKQLKIEVFTACIVRVSRGILPFGAFKAVAEGYSIDPKTVHRLWNSTMTQVAGYQTNQPIDPSFVVANLPTTAVFDTKFHSTGQKPQFDNETVMQEIQEDLFDLWLVLLEYQY
jgi:hypothetical protein